MRNKLKFVILSCLLITVVLLATSCSSDLSPFGDFNKEGFTVSVKYDANGGLFTTNTETIIDTYNLDEYKTNGEGKKEIKLFAPDASERGGQAYTATNEGYFLAGWYTERYEIKDTSGNVTGYTYGGRWDFSSDKYAVATDKEYDSAEPALTLYAAWIPSFVYEFYTFDESGNEVFLDKVEKSPLGDTALTLPAFDEKTGMVNAPNDFPAIDGKTYDKIYTDKDKTLEVTTETLIHSGKFVAESATLENATMKIYCTATEGIQYKITTPEQLIQSPDAAAHYTLESDLDFEGKYWPQALCVREFTGKLIGNGHTIKNVTVSQNDGTNKFFGLFGKLTNSAVLSDVTFDNITVNINSGSSSIGATFGILTGEIEDDADIQNVTLQNSTIVILRNAALYVSIKSNAPYFGLVCALGDINGIAFSSENVTVTFSESGSYNYTYTPDAEGHFTLTEATNG